MSFGVLHELNTTAHNNATKVSFFIIIEFVYKICANIHKFKDTSKTSLKKNYFLDDKIDID